MITWRHWLLGNEDRYHSVTEFRARLAVLIAGDSGTGKTGIGVAVTRGAQANNQRVALIDAGKFQHLEDE